MIRRRFLSALLVSPVLGACSNNLSMKTLDAVLENTLGDRAAFDPAYPESLPYASMSVRLPNLKRALVILGRVEGDEFHWYTADRGVLVTRHGRLVRTVGFGSNLQATAFIDADFLESGVSLEPGRVFRRQVDLQPGHHFGLQIEAKLYPAAEEVVRVGNSEMRLQRLDERVVFENSGDVVVNRFWVDAQRRVWKSEQQPIPGFSIFEIEVTKAYIPG